jgi:hypothetical protein
MLIMMGISSKEIGVAYSFVFSDTILCLSSLFVWFKSEKIVEKK